MAESDEGLQEPRVGILGEEWLGTDEVVGEEDKTCSWSLEGVVSAVELSSVA